MSHSKLVDGSKITSAQYNLPSFDGFAEQMQSAVRNAVDDFIRGAIGERASINLPYCNKEFEKDKPLLASISVPLGQEEDPPIWQFDIEEAIRNFVDDRSDGSRHLDDGEREVVQTMRDKLAELVLHYDKKLGAD